MSKTFYAIRGAIVTLLVVLFVALVIWLILRGVAGVTLVSFVDVVLGVSLFILAWFGALFGVSQYDLHKGGK